MSTRTVDPHSFRRVPLTVFVLLAATAVLAGIWPISGLLATWVPVLIVPEAAGLPSLVPPLRLWPLGETTWAFWASDTVGALVMLAIAAVQLRAAARKHPAPGPGRAFGIAVGTTTIALIGGNLVRSVFLSFAVDADLGTYLGQVIAGVVVSALAGALLGCLFGAVAAIVAAARRGPAVAPALE
ncbi:hypothetical protein ACFVTX_11050 [Agromyces sp. NPDC058136]|uniref:hypothetical protein n=1 Tax=Agromyces sp. NPDC058136 TaxID=3346354 RepID=UPI0036DF048B